MNESYDTACKATRLVNFAYEKLAVVWPFQTSSLTDKGWRFQWCNSKRTVGWCKYDRKTIELSRNYLIETEERLQDTILHEIAHALAGYSAGHGPNWKYWCRIVGAKEQRCATGYESAAKHRWIGTCKCGYESKRHRKPKYINNTWHIKCGEINGLLTWRFNND